MGHVSKIPLKILRPNCLTLSFLQFTVFFVNTKLKSFGKNNLDQRFIFEQFFLKWDKLFLSIFSAMIETKEVPPIVSLKTAILGDNVTLHCGAEEKTRNILWYKQSIGYVPQKIVLIVGDYGEIIPPFDSIFTAAKPDMDLIIRSVSKEDEANYFCQDHYSKNWSGLFLSVKGKISCSTCFLCYHLKVAEIYSISQF